MFYGIKIIGNRWKQDILIGVGLGASFIVGNILSPAISIGLPSLALDITSTERIIVIGAIAPIAEEALFRGALLGLLDQLKIPFIFAALTSALTFMIYHLTAYGSSLAAASGAFIGAFLFGFLAAYISKWRQSLLPGMILHAIFNLWLLSKLVIVT